MTRSRGPQPGERPSSGAGLGAVPGLPGRDGVQAFATRSTVVPSNPRSASTSSGASRCQGPQALVEGVQLWPASVLAGATSANDAGRVRPDLTLALDGVHVGRREGAATVLRPHRSARGRPDPIEGPPQDAGQPQKGGEHARTGQGEQGERDQDHSRHASRSRPRGAHGAAPFSGDYQARMWIMAGRDRWR